MVEVPPPAPSRRSPLRVYVCRAKSCTRRGAAALAAGLETSFSEQGLPAQVLRHDCFDLCKQACNVLVELPGHEQRLYTQVHPKQAERFTQSLAAEVGAAVPADERPPAA